MCFQVLQIFFEYRGRPWTGTIFKFMEKWLFVPFSWVIYLLFQHYEPLNFLACKSVPCRLSKELVVSSALDHCLVLFKSTFSKKFNDFDKNNFLHFQALLKRKRQPGKKIVNSRNFMFMEEFNHNAFSGPTNTFWVRGEALNRDQFL